MSENYLFRPREGEEAAAPRWSVMYGVPYMDEHILEVVQRHSIWLAVNRRQHVDLRDALTRHLAAAHDRRLELGRQQ
jgi:hypothetical protein